MVKTCFKCGKAKPLVDFYVHKRMADGHLNKCKECTKKDVQARYVATRPERHAYEKRRNETPERREQWRRYSKARRKINRLQIRARTLVGSAIRDGKLVPQPCEQCSATQYIQGHHDDYSKPLDVRWLCFRCHRAHHGHVTTSSPGGNSERPRKRVA